MTIQEAYLKFSHIAHDAIKYAIAKGLILGSELDLTSKPKFCDACAKAKASCQPFPKISNTQAERYGERVFWDLWGPVTIHSQGGNFYATARMDDHTHEMKLYFLKTKNQIFEAYKWDEAYLETHSGNHIKWMHSDWGGKFLSKEMKNHQDSKGTLHKLTVHDSPQQNGIAECGNQMWAEQAHAMLISSGLPWFLWEEAMKHSAWLQNRTPTCALDRKTPYEMWHGKKPYLAGIQEFRTMAYMKDLDVGKLDPKAHIGRFMGYDSKSKGYQIYLPKQKSISVEMWYSMQTMSP